MKTYWVYMLECSDKSFYIGVTNNLEYRVGQHDYGEDTECYTASRRPVKLVYSTEFHDVNEAISWEKHIKRWSRAKKRALVANDWELISKLAKPKTRILLESD